MPLPPTRVHRIACAALASVAVAALAGCARMDAALGRQWLVVQFNPNTTIAAARHVTTSCSHVPATHGVTITADAANTGMVESARYNVSRASDADLARLQECLQHYPVVQGVTLDDSGGY